MHQAQSESVSRKGRKTRLLHPCWHVHVCLHLSAGMYVCTTHMAYHMMQDAKRAWHDARCMMQDPAAGHVIGFYTCSAAGPDSVSCRWLYEVHKLHIAIFGSNRKRGAFLQFF